MKKFRLHQEINVVSGDLHGQSGKVVRLRHADNGAWVAMEKELPDHLVKFPAGDSRHNNVILYPWLCEKNNNKNNNLQRR